jgi:hypothetical protein
VTEASAPQGADPKSLLLLWLSLQLDVPVEVMMHGHGGELSIRHSDRNRGSLAECIAFGHHRVITEFRADLSPPCHSKG